MYILNINLGAGFFFLHILEALLPRKGIVFGRNINKLIFSQLHVGLLIIALGFNHTIILITFFRFRNIHAYILSYVVVYKALNQLVAVLTQEN